MLFFQPIRQGKLIRLCVRLAKTSASKWERKDELKKSQSAETENGSSNLSKNVNFFDAISDDVHKKSETINIASNTEQSVPSYSDPELIPVDSLKAKLNVLKQGRDILEEPSSNSHVRKDILTGHSEKTVNAESSVQFCDKFSEILIDTSEVDRILDFLNAASLNDLAKIRGVTARQAMCFLNRKEQLEHKKFTDLDDAQDALYLQLNNVESACTDIRRKVSPSFSAEWEKHEEKYKLSREMKLLRSSCVPFPSVSELCAVNSVISVNYSLNGFQWVKMDFREEDICISDFDILFFKDVSEIRISDKKEFSVARLLEAIDDCVAYLPDADCYVFEEKLVKSQGISFVHNRLTTIHALTQACLHFRHSGHANNIVTAKCLTAAKYFELDKSGTALADVRQFVPGILRSEARVKNISGRILCEKPGLVEMFGDVPVKRNRGLSGEVNSISKLSSAEVQSLSYAVLLGLMFAGIRQFYVR